MKAGRVINATLPRVTPMTRPAFIQGGAHPIFRGRSQESLRCRECGAVLVEGYDPRALIAVDLECFACRTVTSTPAWPDNEPLPQHLVRAGTGGLRYLIGSTVDMTQGGAFASDEEVVRIGEKMWPRQQEHLAWDLSPASLNAFG